MFTYLSCCSHLLDPAIRQPPEAETAGTENEEPSWAWGFLLSGHIPVLCLYDPWTPGNIGGFVSETLEPAF